jgi:ribonuclease P protein component
MFPARLRLSKKDFLTKRLHIVYRGSLFDIRQMEDDGKGWRIACIIAKKTLKKATERNKVRRRVLHVIKEGISYSNKQKAYIVYPKKEANKEEINALRLEIKKAFATLV